MRFKNEETVCHPCNRGIGMLQDDPDVLEEAAEYLRRSRR